jgi:hypothetical protein
MLWTLLLACDTAAPADAASPPPIELGPLVECADPVAGIDRLTEAGQARGLVTGPVAQPSRRACNLVPGTVIAEDLDGDGDPDVVLRSPDGLPAVYWNLDGQLLPLVNELPSPDPDRELYGVAAVDLTGDDLPELLVTGQGLLAMAPNLGELTWGPWELLVDLPEFPRSCHQTVSWGDVDQDGDLDLILPASDRVDDADTPGSGDPPWVAGTHLLLLQDQGAFEVVPLPEPETGGTLSLLGSAIRWNDRTGVLIGADRTFANGDALGWYEWVDDKACDLTSSVGLGHGVDAMGLTSTDLDRDGVLDRCMSDQAPALVCLSESDHGALDRGPAMGLSVDFDDHPEIFDDQDTTDLRAAWTGWSVEAVDLDNDGWEDVAVVAGPPPNEGSVAYTPVPDFQPDRLYQGGPQGFTDVSAAVGFQDAASHYGMASADLDGDGWRELIVAGFQTDPQVWDNPCGASAWAAIDLVGPAGNRSATGAQIRVTAGDDTWTQELLGQRTAGQSPSTLHVGLGDHEQIDRLEVLWPEGGITEYTDVPVRRTITVSHPER